MKKLNVFFLIFLLLVQPVCNEENPCKLKASPAVSHLTVCSGESFNLTCRFACLTNGVDLEMLKNNIVVSSIYLRSTTTVASFNASLSLLVPAATEADSGKYECGTIPRHTLETLTLQIKDCPPEVTLSDAQPTDNPEPTYTWDLQKSLMWYLLCKTGVFLMCSLSIGLKSSCLKI